MKYQFYNKNYDLIADDFQEQIKFAFAIYP